MPEVEPLAPEHFITIDEAADYYRVTPKTIRRMISRGDLRAVRLPGTRIVRLRVADLSSSAAWIPTATPRSRR